MVIKKKKLNIIILGANSAIGYYLAKKFYQENNNILLTGNNNNKFNNLKKKFPKQSLQEIYFDQLDITKNEKVLSFIKKNRKFLKKADLIVNAIGDQGEIDNFFKLNYRDFKRTFDVNFFSHVYFLSQLRKFIGKNKKKLFIVFSGGGATSKRSNFSSYSISKIALVKLVEILSYEFNNKNIRINAIAPGIINSHMTQKSLKTKNKISLKEIVKIKKELKVSDKSLHKIYLLINFLMSKNGESISGKLISSRWDKFAKWNKIKIKKIISSDIYTMRRRYNF